MQYVSSYTKYLAPEPVSLTERTTVSGEENGFMRSTEQPIAQLYKIARSLQYGRPCVSDAIHVAANVEENSVVK